jgi:PAS domain-containing protein
MQGKRYVVGVEQDVTAREAERVELDTTRQLLIDAIESIDDGLMLFDSEDHLVAFNHKATRVLSQVADFIEAGATYQSIMAAYAARLEPERR